MLDSFLLHAVRSFFNAFHTHIQLDIRPLRNPQNIKIAEQKLPDGAYMSYISLVDERGDVYDMQVTSFEIKNGTMTKADVVKMP